MSQPLYVGRPLTSVALDEAVLIGDTSTVRQAEPPHVLVVQARGWPMG